MALNCKPLQDQIDKSHTVIMHEMLRFWLNLSSIIIIKLNSKILTVLYELVKLVNLPT